MIKFPLHKINDIFRIQSKRWTLGRVEKRYRRGNFLHTSAVVRKSTPKKFFVNDDPNTVTFDPDTGKAVLPPETYSKPRVQRIWIPEKLERPPKRHPMVPKVLSIDMQNAALHFKRVPKGKGKISYRMNELQVAEKEATEFSAIIPENKVGTNTLQNQSGPKVEKSEKTPRLSVFEILQKGRRRNTRNLGEETKASIERNLFQVEHKTDVVKSMEMKVPEIMEQLESLPRVFHPPQETETSVSQAPHIAYSEKTNEIKEVPTVYAKSEPLQRDNYTGMTTSQHPAGQNTNSLENVTFQSPPSELPQSQILTGGEETQVELTNYQQSAVGVPAQSSIETIYHLVSQLVKSGGVSESELEDLKIQLKLALAKKEVERLKGEALKLQAIKNQKAKAVDESSEAGNKLSKNELSTEANVSLIQEGGSESLQFEAPTEVAFDKKESSEGHRFPVIKKVDEEDQDVKDNTREEIGTKVIVSKSHDIRDEHIQSYLTEIGISPSAVSQSRQSRAMQSGRSLMQARSASQSGGTGPKKTLDTSKDSRAWREPKTEKEPPEKPTEKKDKDQEILEEPETDKRKSIDVKSQGNLENQKRPEVVSTTFEDSFKDEFIAEDKQNERDAFKLQQAKSVLTSKAPDPPKPKEVFIGTAFEESLRDDIVQVEPENPFKAKNKDRSNKSGSSEKQQSKELEPSVKLTPEEEFIRNKIKSKKPKEKKREIKSWSSYTFFDKIKDKINEGKDVAQKAMDAAEEKLPAKPELKDEKAPAVLPEKADLSKKSPSEKEASTINENILSKETLRKKSDVPDEIVKKSPQLASEKESSIQKEISKDSESKILEDFKEAIGTSKTIQIKDSLKEPLVEDNQKVKDKEDAVKAKESSQKAKNKTEEVTEPKSSNEKNKVKKVEHSPKEKVEAKETDKKQISSKPEKKSKDDGAVEVKSFEQSIDADFEFEDGNIFSSNLPVDKKEPKVKPILKAEPQIKSKKPASSSHDAKDKKVITPDKTKSTPDKVKSSADSKLAKETKILEEILETIQKHHNVTRENKKTAKEIKSKVKVITEETTEKLAADLSKSQVANENKEVESKKADARSLDPTEIKVVDTVESITVKDLSSKTEVKEKDSVKADSDKPETSKAKEGAPVEVIKVKEQEKITNVLDKKEKAKSDKKPKEEDLKDHQTPSILKVDAKVESKEAKGEGSSQKKSEDISIDKPSKSSLSGESVTQMEEKKATDVGTEPKVDKIDSKQDALQLDKKEKVKDKKDQASNKEDSKNVVVIEVKGEMKPKLPITEDRKKNDSGEKKVSDSLKTEESDKKDSNTEEQMLSKDRQREEDIAELEKVLKLMKEEENLVEKASQSRDQTKSAADDEKTRLEMEIKRLREEDLEVAKRKVEEIEKVKAELAREIREEEKRLRAEENERRAQQRAIEKAERKRLQDLEAERKAMERRVKKYEEKRLKEEELLKHAWQKLVENAEKQKVKDVQSHMKALDKLTHQVEEKRKKDIASDVLEAIKVAEKMEHKSLEEQQKDRRKMMKETAKEHEKILKQQSAEARAAQKRALESMIEAEKMKLKNEEFTEGEDPHLGPHEKSVRSASKIWKPVPPDYKTIDYEAKLKAQKAEAEAAEAMEVKGWKTKESSLWRENEEAKDLEEWLAKEETLIKDEWEKERIRPLRERLLEMWKKNKEKKASDKSSPEGTKPPKKPTSPEDSKGKYK